MGLRDDIIQARLVESPVGYMVTPETVYNTEWMVSGNAPWLTIDVKEWWLRGHRPPQPLSAAVSRILAGAERGKIRSRYDIN